MKTAPKTESMTPTGRISAPGPGFSAVVAGHTSPHGAISGSRLPQGLTPGALGHTRPLRRRQPKEPNMSKHARPRRPARTPPSFPAVKRSSLPRGSLTSTHHDKKRRKTGTYSPSGTPCSRPCPRPGALRGRPPARRPGKPALDPAASGQRRRSAGRWRASLGSGLHRGSLKTHFCTSGLPSACQLKESTR